MFTRHDLYLDEPWLAAPVEEDIEPKRRAPPPPSRIAQGRSRGAAAAAEHISASSHETRTRRRCERAATCGARRRRRRDRCLRVSRGGRGRGGASESVRVRACEGGTRQRKSAPPPDGGLSRRALVLLSMRKGRDGATTRSEGRGDFPRSALAAAGARSRRAHPRSSKQRSGSAHTASPLLQPPPPPYAPNAPPPPPPLLPLLSRTQRR